MQLVEVTAGGNRHTVPEGESLSFGRGGRVRVDLELSDDPALSALAGRLTHMPYGVHIACLQRTEAGSMSVVLPGGQSVARMTRGNEYVCSDPAFQVQLLVGRQGTLLVLHVRHPSADSPVPSAAAENPGIVPDQRTITSWRAADVISPSFDSRWQTVCALACLRVVGATDPAPPEVWEARVPTFNWLRATCEVYFGLPASTRWLSERLDEALVALGLPRDGQDKIARIVATVVGGRYLQPDTLRAVASRLEQKQARRTGIGRAAR